MNIHEHQAKEILKKYGIIVPNGVAIFSVEEIDESLSPTLLYQTKICEELKVPACQRKMKTATCAGGPNLI